MAVKSFPLPLPESLTPPVFINKAGVLPFAKNENGEWQVLLMKPVAKKDPSNPPPFQLCKGTRMQQQADGTWADVKDGQMPADEGALENLLETAKREVEEEAGLSFSATQNFFDMGPVAFVSASTGEAKWMQLFAAVLEARDMSVVGKDLSAAGTQDVQWLSVESAVPPLVREDHAALIGQAFAHLAQSEHLSPTKGSSYFQK